MSSSSSNVMYLFFHRLEISLLVVLMDVEENCSNSSILKIIRTNTVTSFRLITGRTIGCKMQAMNEREGDYVVGFRFDVT